VLVRCVRVCLLCVGVCVVFVSCLCRFTNGVNAPDTLVEKFREAAPFDVLKMHLTSAQANVEIQASCLILLQRWVLDNRTCCCREA
jgi:hypothetical protein